MNTKAQILSHFLASRGQFVSGSQIGDHLGLSRVSVHNHLEVLRKEGFTFSAIRNKGYRLEQEPNQLHPELLTALLNEQPCSFFKGYQIYDEVESTNSLADLALANGAAAPLCVMAGAQSAGRGRRGRVWHSPAGKNLYLSIGLRPQLSPSRLQTITLWMGLRICEFLRERFALPVLVKWPNDLMLHDRKIAGILTEARVDAEATRDLVLGIGLNVNASAEDFPAELGEIASSIAIAAGKTVNLSRLAHSILGVASNAISDYLDDQFTGELTRQWPEFDYLRGRQIKAGEIDGRALGIAANGSLRIERMDGSTLLLHSGEVSIATQS